MTFLFVPVADGGALNSRDVVTVLPAFVVLFVTAGLHLVLPSYGWQLT